MILDFTITTCLRPDILRRTLESFRENLRGVEWGKCRAFVNIDMTGYEGIEEVPIKEVVDVVSETFQFHAFRYVRVPSFPAAVKWCFAQPQTTYCWHQEDDWILTEPINIADVVHELESDDQGLRQMVNLRAKPFNPTRRCFLSPGLWRSRFMREVSEQMKANINPEVELWNITDRYTAGHYWPLAMNRIVLKDIGREWLATSGFKKDVEVQRGVNPFTRWVQR